MKLTGLISATYTPFHSDGSVNLDLVAPMVDHMIERGVSGFYVCGSTGEGESLSVEERKSLAKAFVSATRKRVPVVIQVGHNTIDSAAELARHAEVIGADAISSVPPSYFRPDSLDTLVDCIEKITSSAPNLPYYYYHIPRLSGTSFDTVALLEKAEQRIPSFNGIKFSDFFLAEMLWCQEFAQGKYDILFGSDEMILGALSMGAKGAVGSCYGFAAPLWRNIITSFEAGDIDKAQYWMSKAANLVRMIATQPGPFQGCVREVIWPMLGFDVGPMRLPNPTLSDEARDLARKNLEESGFADQIISGDYQ